MIVDRIEHRFLYQGLSGRIPAALDYLQRTDFHQAATGRFELDGDKLIAIVADYTPKALENAVWESHRRYIDVQFVVAGIERMGWAHAIPGLPEKMSYDEERDLVLYEPGCDFITMRPGQFAIFFPHDIHAPGLALPIEASDSNSDAVTQSVRKVVVKVAMGA